MQEETMNTLEGLSEDDLQRITGGCGSCAKVDGRILGEAHRTLQEYRKTMRASGNPQAIPAEQFHHVRNQGVEAASRIMERHPNRSQFILLRYYQELRPQPDDPPIPLPQGNS